MNRFYTLIIILVCISKFTVAQKRVVSGVVKDSLSNTVLESATVSVFAKDSSIVTYQLSDKFGGFELKDIPVTDSLRLNITYVGYKPYDQLLVFDSSHYHAIIFLTPSFNDSQSVTVVSHVPVRMNGDTLEINPAAFKLDPNAVVEDLLAQVPGITIWADGTITMNGRKIPSVLVDGKPFSGSTDAKIATQNLPKDAIDKIQVYQEVDRSVRPDERQPKDSLLTMNIKLKEDKKTGYFGKAGFGYGTNNRFESDLSFQTYNKRSSFGFGGGYNNINKNISNLNEMFQNNTYRNFNPNLYYVGNFNTNGINKYHSIGGVYTHNFIDNTNSRQNDRITVNYVKSGNENYLTNLSQQNRTALDNPQFVQDNSTSQGTTSDHVLGIQYIKTNSYNDNFSVNGNANINNSKVNTKQETNVWDTLNNLQSTNTSQSFTNTKANGQSLSVNYSTNSEENPLQQFSGDLTVNNSSNISNRSVVSNFISYIDPTQNTFYNRRYYNDNHQLNATTNLAYNGLKRLIFGRYDLFGIDLNLVNWISYTKTSTKSNVDDFDSSLKKYTANSALTYNDGLEKLEYSPNFKMSKNFFKWNEKRYKSIFFNVSLIEDLKNERTTSSIADRNLSRSFSFFRYEGNASYNYSKINHYYYYINANYRKSFDYPSIDQLYTITDSLDIYNIRTGNPYLKNTINHNYNLSGNLFSQNQKSKYGYNVSLNMDYTKAINPVVDSLINDASGKRFYYYVNASQNQSFNINYNINLSRRFGKNNNVQVSYNGSFNKNNLPVYIDNIFSRTTTLGQNHSIGLQLEFNSKVIINIGKTYGINKSIQSAAGLNSFKNTSDVSRFGLTVNYPNNYTFSSTLDYTTNTNIQKPIALWNAFASHRFLKSQQMEIKFSAMDILKQFKNISNYADSYGTSVTTTNGLQQFFLLTLSYYPRKFGKTEIKRKQNEQIW